MKIVPTKITLLFFGLICSNIMFAAPEPPPPVPPPPPGLPVDGALVALFLGAIVLGFYKLQILKKASK